MPALYSIDTSALVNPWGRLYQPDLIPSIWEHVGRLIEDGTVQLSIEVYNEIERQSDDLHEWCKAYRGHFVDLTDDVQESVIEILGAYPRLVGTGDKGKADPFVIALARTYDPLLTVVTEEGRGTEGSPKIPRVCAGVGVPCCNFNKFLRDTRWREGGRT